MITAQAPQGSTPSHEKLVKPHNSSTRGNLVPLPSFHIRAQIRYRQGP